ncbi:glycoside hydrolase superfamily [Syncephalastrum racemosum]|uniref:glucan endo-1,3-beta-D-glucosidase n=1 Tax=Syncephalastrum racemosum TaxID=13706 RepID=A0A1X2HTD2_SYNRA|nr:glycoside hydrolase superfamily [Syncephalastrum racemosum]
MQFLYLALIFVIAGIAQAMPVEKRAGGHLFGITYTGKHPDGSCHTAPQVLTEVQRFKKNGITNIRTYAAAECNLLTNILAAFQKVDGMKVLAGVWINGDNAANQKEKSAAVKIVKGADKKFINGVMVGNEVVQSNLLSAAALAGHINDVKGQLPGVQVGTVETPDSFKPELIAAAQKLGVNIHPFFANTVTAANGVKNLHDSFNAFKAKANGKPVIVTETGWPSAGQANGAAVPSVANLQTFVKDILPVTDINYYYFESQDANWKSGGAFNVEPHWGLTDASGKSKIPQYQ